MILLKRFGKKDICLLMTEWTYAGKIQNIFVLSFSTQTNHDETFHNMMFLSRTQKGDNNNNIVYLLKT